MSRSWGIMTAGVGQTCERSKCRHHLLGGSVQNEPCLGGRGVKSDALVQVTRMRIENDCDCCAVVRTHEGKRACLIRSFCHPNGSLQTMRRCKLHRSAGLLDDLRQAALRCRRGTREENQEAQHSLSFPAQRWRPSAAWSGLGTRAR